MSSKRKLIKKARNLNKINQQIQETQIESSQSILEKLKSSNPLLIEQAIIILANIHCPIAQITSPEFIREIINVLYQGSNSLVYETIFSLSNLCEIQPKIISILFQNGLDKALIQLSATDKQLLKPILIFFITIAESLPKKYQYLLHGVQNSLSSSHLKQNTELVLQFIFRTKHLRPSESPNITSEQLINQIVNIFTSSYNVKQKSYAIAILSIAFENKWNPNIQEMLLNYMTEILVCIDLEKQYQMNFNQVKKQKEQQKNHQNLEEQENQDQMEDQEEIGKMNSNQKKAVRKAELQKKKQKLRFFMNTIEGTQILLEFILDVLEAGDFDEEDNEQNDDFQQQNEHQNKMTQGQTQSSLRQIIFGFIKQNMTIFPKFLCLSSSIVPSTQNIVYLFYHLLTHVDKQLSQSMKNNPGLNNSLIEINQLIQISLQSLFKKSLQSINQANQLSTEQYEVLVECLEIALKILLKNKALGVTYQFLTQFSFKYLLSNLIFSSLKLLETIKPSWLIVLELYSIKFNPEKPLTFINLTPQQNYQIGNLLKHLLVSIPYTQLEQLRCQVIDTIFDVYSNQNFDKVFVELGIMNLLEMILNNSQKQLQNISKVSGKQRKKQKFITDVLKDVKRFLQYKRQMIKQTK